MESHEQIVWQNSGSDRRVERHWRGNRQRPRGGRRGRRQITYQLSPLQIEHFVDGNGMVKILTMFFNASSVRDDCSMMAGFLSLANWLSLIARPIENRSEL
jgi:hypothetical protein